MSVDFTFADFFKPISLLRLHSRFEKNQWLSSDELQNIQETHLDRILRHAIRHVPHYRQAAADSGIAGKSRYDLADLKSFNTVSRDAIAEEPLRFLADNHANFKPIAMHTSGSSGKRLDFFVDRATNVLEFVYYWRYWGWAGYRLMDPFAEFSSTFFLKPGNERHGLSYHQRGTGRLLLNSLYLSDTVVRAHLDLLIRHQAKYLKSLPSVVFAFVRLAKDLGLSTPKLRAVFTTGEILLSYQREAIEAAFGCSVFDSYGHMERAVAASECERGNLHVNSDYGLLELGKPLDEKSADGRIRAPILATSLHSFSMPFIRYETGDVAVFAENTGCRCGRGFPLLERVEGRETDVIVTPSGRVVPTLFLAFEEVPVRFGQIIQESRDRLRVRAVRERGGFDATQRNLEKVIKKFVGDDMAIDIEPVDNEADLLEPGKKFKVIRSCAK